MTPSKYIELTSPNQIDRYKFSGTSVDIFLDLIMPFAKDVRGLTEEEYESSKTHELEYNYGEIQVERYVFKHPSKEARNSFNRVVRSIRREKFLEIFSQNETL